MLVHGELNAKVVQCERTVRGNLKAELFVYTLGLPFGFDLTLLENFILICKFHGDRGTLKSKRNLSKLIRGISVGSFIVSWL